MHALIIAATLATSCSNGHLVLYEDMSYKIVERQGEETCDITSIDPDVVVDGDVFEWTVFRGGLKVRYSYTCGQPFPETVKIVSASIWKGN